MKVWREFLSDFENRVKLHKKAHALLQSKLLKYSNKNFKVLEVGCGTAIDSSFLSSNGRKVIALDSNKDALEVAKKVNTYFKTKVKLVKADLRRLPFKKESFNLVFSSGVIHYFDRIDDLIKEQKRVLKRNGFLIIDVPYKYSLFTIEKNLKRILGKWPWGKEKQYSKNELKKILERNNFKVIEFFNWELDSLSKFLFKFYENRFGRRLPNFIRRICKFISLPFQRFIENKFSVNVGIVAQKIS